MIPCILTGDCADHDNSKWRQRHERIRAMAFQNFSFPQVAQDLGLTLEDSDLFSQVAAGIVRPEFLAQTLEGANLASAINTEKARSEFVIAPVLLELRRQHAGHLALAWDSASPRCVPLSC
jgi:hypothetical protein